MKIPFFQKGFIHLGLLAVVIVGLAVFASVKIFADRDTSQRPLGFNQILCQIRSNDIFCQDSDNDGWTDGLELYLGTDPNLVCATQYQPSGWPPDINSDRVVNSQDREQLQAHFNTKDGDPNFNRRFDFDRNGQVDIADVRLLASYGNQACTQPSSTEADTDNDGFSDQDEIRLGTNPSLACSPDNEVDAWPPDLDKNRTVNRQDADLLASHFGSSRERAGYNPRFDLNGNGRVEIDDITLLAPYMGKECTVGTSSPQPSPTPTPQSTPAPTDTPQTTPTLSPSPQATPTPASTVPPSKQK